MTIAQMLESQGIPVSPEVKRGELPLAWRVHKWHPLTKDPKAIASDNAKLAVRRLHPEGAPSDCACDPCKAWGVIRDAELRAILSR